MAALYTIDQKLQVNDYYAKVIKAKKYDNTIQAVIKRGPTPENWEQKIELEEATPAYDLAAAEGGDFDETGLVARTNLMCEVTCQKFRTKRGYFVTDETKLLPGYTEKKGEAALARAIRRDAEELVRSIELTLGSAQEAVGRGTAAGTIAKTRGIMSWLSKTAHTTQAIPTAFMPTCGITGDMTDSSVLSEDLFRKELIKAAIESGDGHIALTGLCGLKLKDLMSQWLGKATNVSGMDTVLRRTEPKSRKIELICDEFNYDNVTVRTLVCNSLNATLPASGAVTVGDTSWYSGAFIRPEFWTIDTLKSLTNRSLENKGGGERGFHEAILRLACRNPLSQFALVHSV